MKKIRYALLTGGLSAAMVITAVLPACAEETMVLAGNRNRRK